VTLIVPDHDNALVDAVQALFQDNKISCDRLTFEDTIPEGQDIISMVDFGEPYLYNITAAKWTTFITCLCSFKGSMIWVTPSTQTSPNSSMIHGMTRTLRAELRKDVTVVEIDDTESRAYLSSSKSLLKIYQGLNERRKARDVDPDYEYWIADGGDIKVPRFHWTTGEQQLASIAAPSTKAVTKENPTPATPATPVQFRSDAGYLLVGGLGGLGRAISTWMVENGARNIIFFSRSAEESPGTTPFFNELRGKGCMVSTFAGSVNKLSDVKDAVEQSDVPIAGVMQMSAVMKVSISYLSEFQTNL
jgi:hypothetical protein